MDKNTIKVKKCSSLSTRIIKDLKKNTCIYIMMAPVIVYFILFRYFAMGWLSIAFYDFKLLKGFSGSEFVGFKNFVDFFSSRNFGEILSNTVVFNIYAIFFQMLAPIIFALLLNELRNAKVKRTIQTISFMPYFISTVVVVSIIMNFLSPSIGVFNTVRQVMGLPTIYYLGIPEYFRTINIVSGVWQMMGWNAVIYISSLTTIDPQLYEAAVVDGANRLRRLWSITIPGIRTTIAIMLALNIGNLLSANVEKVLLLQNDLNLSISEMLPTYVYKLGIVRGDYSYGTTVGLFTALVSCILVIIANRAAKKISDSEVGVF